VNDHRSVRVVEERCRLDADAPRELSRRLDGYRKSTDLGSGWDRGVPRDWQLKDAMGEALGGGPECSLGLNAAVRAGMLEMTAPTNQEPPHPPVGRHPWLLLRAGTRLNGRVGGRGPCGDEAQTICR
jgi:hypothetical protein